MHDYLIAFFLGIVEGLTEFIPVSSTAHLLILVDGLNLPTPPGHVFEVFIQLGAILAVIVLYHRKLFHTALSITKEKQSQRFALNVIVGTLPALFIGALAHGFVKEVLYNNPQIIAAALILGGLAIFWLEKKFKQARYETVDDISLKAAFLVGCCQAVALIPGVSRSGATIMGGLVLGLSRPAATEFSFFLSIPVMCAAVLYDVYKNRSEIMASHDMMGLMLTGFIAAFLSALIVIRYAVGFISKHGFTPFAWYRIAAGIVILMVFF